MNIAGDDQTKWKAAFEDLAEASRLMDKKRLTAKPSRYAGVWTEIIRPLDGDGPFQGEAGKRYIVNPEGSAFFRNLVFLKLGITFRELIMQVEMDPTAHMKLLRIHKEFYRFRWVTRGYKNLRLKFNLNHFSFLLQGMDWGLGELNEIELESCFNEICPCALRHSGEYLKKLRTQLKKACEHIQRSASKPTSIDVPTGGGIST